MGAVLQYVRHSGFFPLKNQLLVGEKLVGRLSKVVDPSIPILSPIGNDSQFFWAISQDPFISNTQVINALDSPAYRYQRILLPLLTWLTPGSVKSLPYRLWCVNAFGWILGLFAMVLIAQQQKIPITWLSLVYILSGGLWFCLFHPMSDLWATALALWGLYYCLREKWYSAAVFWALAALAKETAVLLPLSVGLYYVLRGKYFTRITMAMILSIVPAILWQFYICSILHVWPFQQSSNNFDFPCFGAVKGMFFSSGNLDYLSTIAAALSILFLLGLIIKIRLPRTVLEMLIWVQAIFLSFSGPAIMEGIGSICRVFLLVTIYSAIYFSGKLSANCAPYLNRQIENEL